MTQLIYKVAIDETEWISDNKRLLLGVAIVLPSLIIFPSTIYKGNGPCYQGQIAFNCVCPNYTQPYYYYILNWMVPCIMLTVFIICMIVLIEKNRSRLGLREEQRLALGAYYIPVANFVFLIFNIILDSVENENHNAAVEDFIMFVNLLIFLMPVINLLAILRYMKLEDDLYTKTSQLTDLESTLQSPPLGRSADSR
jgi:hypothetical protein